MAAIGKIMAKDEEGMIYELEDVADQYSTNFYSPFHHVYESDAIKAYIVDTGETVYIHTARDDKWYGVKAYGVKATGRAERRAKIDEDWYVDVGDPRLRKGPMHYKQAATYAAKVMEENRKAPSPEERKPVMVWWGPYEMVEFNRYSEKLIYADVDRIESQSMYIMTAMIRGWKGEVARTLGQVDGTPSGQPQPPPEPQPGSETEEPPDSRMIDYKEHWKKNPLP